MWTLRGNKNIWVIRFNNDGMVRAVIGICKWCLPISSTDEFVVFIAGWKPLYWLFGPKINLSGISPAKHSQSGPNLVYVDMSRGDNFQGILGLIGPFGQHGGWDESCRAQVFFCVVIQTSFQQLCNGQFLPNLATKRNSLSRRGIWKDNFQTFLLLGSFAPKSEIKSRSNRHLTQDMGCTAERYCLLHVVVQGPDSFWDRSTFLYDVWLQSYEASKLPNFRTSAHFSHTKLLKRTLQWPAYSPGFTSQNDYDFSMW